MILPLVKILEKSKPSQNNNNQKPPYRVTSKQPFVRQDNNGNSQGNNNYNR